MKKYQAYKRCYESLKALGINEQEADKLRRIELTLGRWAERYCNAEIEIDEQTEEVWAMSSPDGKYLRLYKIPNREKSALKHLDKIMENYPDLIAYHQSDPRGCALYILRKSDVKAGESIDSVYNRGVAVYVNINE